MPACPTHPTSCTIAPRVPHRGKPNSPAMTAHTVRALAALKHMDVADLCMHIQSTGARVFGW